MALIKCPECQHLISEFATHCIYCGCPMSVIKNISKKTTTTAKSKDTKKVKPAPKKESIDPTSTFLERRNPDEVAHIKAFYTFLKTKIDEAILEDRRYICVILIKREEKKYPLCWFADSFSGKVDFKYNSDPISKEGKQGMVFNDENMGKAAKIAVDLYNEFFKNRKNIPIVEEKEETESVFFSQLHNKLIGSTVNGVSSAAKILIEKVYQFVVSGRKFETKFKGNTSYRVAFVGNYMYLPNRISLKDSNEFYYLYLTDEVFKIIRSYESTLGKKIIFDSEQARKSIHDLIAKGECDMSLANGLSSDYSFASAKVLNVLSDIKNIRKS